MKKYQHVSDLLTLIRESDKAVDSLEKCTEVTRKYYESHARKDCPEMSLLYTAVLEYKVKYFIDLYNSCRVDIDFAIEDTFRALQDRGIYLEDISAEFQETVGELLSLMEIDDTTLNRYNDTNSNNNDSSPLTH